MSSLFDGLPSVIRIGPYDIAVSIKDRINDDDPWGEYCRGQSIALKSDQPNPIFATDTFLHEVLHGVYSCCGLEASSSEESVVTGLASGLTQVLRDNPEVFAWLHRMRS